MYPKHGVGKVLSIEKATIGQIEIQFYKIFIEKEKLTLTVPINQQFNLRSIATINQINKCVSIFVARQWIRHRTANVNEYSARYSILDKEFYIPEKEHLAAQSKDNRQGRGTLINGKQADEILNMLKEDAQRNYDDYERMLNEKYDGTVIDEKKQGLARELARMNLTLNAYTQWYWKTDLLNLLNFLSLRADNHAQYEIRAYADVMIDSLKRWVPITYEAFMDYRVGAMEISSKGKSVVKKMIKGENCNFKDSGLSKREWNELMESFGFKENLV